MKKIKKESIKENSHLTSINNDLNMAKTDNSFFENELAIKIKGKREELNIQNEKLYEHKNEMNKISRSLKNELTKLNKINKNILEIEKEIEQIQINITKINKKKLYTKLSLIKIKNLFISTNISKKYLFLLNCELNPKKTNLDLILEENDDEFYYYLEYLENEYKALEKNKKEDFIKFKKTITDYFGNENIGYPYDKLILYLNYIIQSIDLSNELNEKFLKLKKIEMDRNSLDIQIRNLQVNKSENENILKEINNYIELLNNILQQYLFYQNKYKNNSISKDILSKKIKKIESINLQQWNPDKNNKIFPHCKNNKFSNYLTIQNTKYNISNKSSVINIKDENNFNLSKINQIYESKSQNISRNLSFDYLNKLDKPLSKKSSTEKIDISFNDTFKSISNKESDKENISENDESDSPISKINITTRKKNTINVYKKKLNVQIFKNNPISSAISNPNSNIKNKAFKTIYKSKNNSIKSIINENKSNSTRITNKEKKSSSEYDSIPERKNIIYNNSNYIFSIKDKNTNNNTYNNKGIYFMKKIKKNKKFIIDKDKLFNKEIEKIKVNTMKNKNILNNLKRLQSNQKKEIMQKNNLNNKEIILSKNNDKPLFLINNSRNISNKISSLTYCNDKFKIEKELNSKENKDIKNIFYNVNSKKYNDSIKVIKDEMKKSNLLFINRSPIMKNGNHKKHEIKTDLKDDNCCISCT